MRSEHFGTVNGWCKTSRGPYRIVASLPPLMLWKLLLERIGTRHKSWLLPRPTVGTVRV